MKKKRILILSPLPEELVSTLLMSRATDEEAGRLEAVAYKGETRNDLLEAVAGADVIIGDYTNNIEMDAEVLGAAAPCLLVQQPSTGFQHIDVEAAARLNIPVANIAGANTFAVAEHTIMLILASLKKLITCHEKTRRGEWAQDEMAEYGVFELFGKTLGIIGAGRIGVEVARRARAFGPRMVYHDVKRLPEKMESELDLTYLPLDDLVGESDVITVHAPLTRETDKLIDDLLIARMKPSAVLVNVSRGAIVDESALAEALVEGRLGGAALDVYSTEPVSGDNPLLDAPNVVLTPHTAGATNESRLRIMVMSIENVARVLGGEHPVNIVNGVEPGTPQPAGM